MPTKQDESAKQAAAITKKRAEYAAWLTKQGLVDAPDNRTRFTNEGEPVAKKV